MRRSVRMIFDHRARIAAKLDQIRDLPWLGNGDCVENAIQFPSELRIADLTSRLADLDHVLARVFQAHQQLVALYERFGEQPAAFISAEGMDLASIACCLGDHADYMRLRLQEIGEREKTVAEFCERICLADAGGCERLVEATEHQTWVSFLHFILPARVYSDVPEYCRSLKGRFDLGGLILSPSVVGFSRFLRPYSLV